MNSSNLTVSRPLGTDTSKSSNLTNTQLLKREELRRAEEYVKPYIVDMSRDLPEEQPIISIDGCCICSRGNISAICGEAKSKKTFLASALVASAMAIPLDKLNNFKSVDKDMNINVLWVDTEQGERHVRRVIDRISRMTGAKMGGLVSEPRLMTLSLRELSPMDRYQVMMEAVKRYPFDLIVIDGIADLQNNTNDLEESDALVGLLMALSTRTNTHILCVLHTNPGSDKARGHLGSSLQRKAETVIFVHRNGDCSVVEPQFCRNEPFDRFAFAVNEEGIPEICDIPQSGEADINSRIVDILATEYGGVIERVTLWKKLVEALGLNGPTAKMRVKRLIDKGLLAADGNLVRIPSNKVTEKQGVPPCYSVIDVTNVTNVTDVTDVTDVSCSLGTEPLQGSLALDLPSPRPQYYGHYDEDDCPF